MSTNYHSKLTIMKQIVPAVTGLLLLLLLLESCKKESTPTEPGQEMLVADSVLKQAVLTGGEMGDVARGNVEIVRTGNKLFLKFINFQSNNGPDLHVYLSASIGNNAQPPTDYIDLGFLKFTQGNFNYELPANFDVANHPHVLVWCAQFRIQFGYASFL